MRPTYKTLSQTLALVVLMAGLAWASVPFYDWFCRVTGFGGVTTTADVGSDIVLDETIKIQKLWMIWRVSISTLLRYHTHFMKLIFQNSRLYFSFQNLLNATETLRDISHGT